MIQEIVWFSVEVTVETVAADAVVFALSELGAEGTSYSLLAEPGAQATGKPEPGAQRVTVSGFFYAAPDAAKVESKVLEALQIYGIESSLLIAVNIRSVEDKDWLAEWKKHWKPTVTDRFVVVPPWQEVDPEGRIVIRIEPKMAFGTGRHETTRLCLNAIESLYEPGMSFLDVGTGTGILAIAAAKLSGPEAAVEGCDTDPEAVSAAVEQAKLNGSPQIVFRTGSVDEDRTEFDFVCANLTTGDILPILPLLLEKTKKVLVLSGILAEKSSKVTNELKRLGVTGAEVKTHGEWVSVSVRKAG
ncbi:MAG TPA: 50S ribosomal protein L11 methyltransferase [Aridibacter sp.]|nr:50S ribosomal protein L11 methyltransferase [Aridibacter sp.]